jgi:hypothetical protein
VATPIFLPNGELVRVKTDDPREAYEKAMEYYQQSKQAESSFGEVFRGIAQGGIGALEGITSFGAALTDLTAGTDYIDHVEDFFEPIYDATGARVSSPAGEIARFITQFGLGAKGAGMIRKKVAGQTVTARRTPFSQPHPKGMDSTKEYLKNMKNNFIPFVGGDIAVSTMDVPTFGVWDELDEYFFDADPNEEHEEKELTRREEAAKLLSHKLKTGAEAAVFLLAAPAVIKGGASVIGEGIDAMGRTRTAGRVGEALAKSKKKVVNYLNSGDYDPENWNWLDKLTKEFRFRGELPTDVAADLGAAKQAQVTDILTTLEVEMSALSRGMAHLSKTGTITDSDLRRVNNLIRDRLYGSKEAQKQAAKELASIDERFMSRLGKLRYTEDGKVIEISKVSLLDSSDRARGLIDNLSEQLTGYKRFLPKNFIDAININIGHYGYRAYKAHRYGDKYKPKPAELEAAIAELTDNRIAKSRDEAIDILNKLIGKGQSSDAFMVPEFALQGVKIGLLKGRKLDDLPLVRKYMGEITGKDDFGDLLVKTRETVNNLANTVSSYKYFDDIARLNRGRVAGDPNKFLYTQDELADLTRDLSDEFSLDIAGRNTAMIPNDPKKYGDLAGMYTTKPIHDSILGLTNSWTDAPLGWRWYGYFLMGKGLTQMGKTVYSPVTQMRNAVSAAAFPLLNGNVGSFRTLEDSMMTVFDALNRQNKGRMGAYYADAQRHGVVNTGARLSEIDGVIDDASKALGAEAGEFAGKGLDWVRRRRNDFASRTYQGADDMWKIYSWEMEQGRLMNALKKSPDSVLNGPMFERGLLGGPDSSLTKYVGQRWGDIPVADQAKIVRTVAADIVKNTVPNYNRVPQFIKRLRAAPLGNFIAFPAEIMRTTTNALSRSIDELASGIPEIQAIGMRRLMGGMAVTTLVPTGVYEFGKYMTGANDEQVDAYKRSFAAPWERNADLVPIATDKQGNITEFYNFTYTNPYEYLRRPFNAVFNAVNNGVTNGDELSTIAMNAIFNTEGTGALNELLNPFFDESILTAAGIDLARNQTVYGRKIYNDADPLGLKTTKSMAHLFNTLSPNFSPVRLKGTAAEPFYVTTDLKDFPRSVMSGSGLLNPDQSLSKSGEELDPYTEIGQALTGFKVMKPTVERTILYRGFEANDEVRQAASIFNQAVRNPNVVDPEGVAKAYVASNEGRFRALRDLAMAIEDARTLGISDTVIRRQLKKAKVTHVDDIMAGRFVPYFPSEETLAYMQANTESHRASMFPEARIRQEFIKSARTPVLPRETITRPYYQPPPEPYKPAAPYRAQTQAPQSAAAIALRQKELEKLMGLD